jgi:hypothetical protein
MRRPDGSQWYNCSVPLKGDMPEFRVPARAIRIFRIMQARSKHKFWECADLFELKCEPCPIICEAA